MRGHAELGAQPGHVVEVGRAGFVPLVELDLLLDRNAAHPRPADGAGDEALSRVAEGLLRVERRLERRAVGGEPQRVQVDLGPGGVAEDEPGRAPVERLRVADGRQGGEEGGFLFLAVQQVEVPVAAGLGADQGVDPPAAA